MSDDLDRTPAIVADIARFAVSARRVVDRGRDRFTAPDDDDQRRIARSLVVDLSAAADRLPESFRRAHPEVDWRGIRAVRNFVAHDYDGTDDEILWQAIAVQFPRIANDLVSGASSGSRLPVAARTSVPWANGRGTTQEVARSTTDPSVGGWRVSIATITDDAAFSDYTGFDRHLMPLTTGGVRLDVAGTEVDLDRYDVLSFDGHDAVAAVGVTSPSLDLNLICGQSYGESSLVALEVSRSQRLAAGEHESVVLVVLDGEIRIDGEQLGQYDAWGVPEGGGAEVTGVGRIAVGRVTARS